MGDAMETLGATDVTLMQASRKTPHGLQSTPQKHGRQTDQREPSAPAGSGTYRAVRPAPGQEATLPHGESSIDSAKVEGLRFELDIGVWRSSSEVSARCVIDDAECVGEDGFDDE